MEHGIVSVNGVYCVYASRLGMGLWFQLVRLAGELAEIIFPSPLCWLTGYTYSLTIAFLWLLEKAFKQLIPPNPFFLAVNKGFLQAMVSLDDNKDCFKCGKLKYFSDTVNNSGSPSKWVAMNHLVKDYA